jgi:hypothetical protein
MKNKAFYDKDAPTKNLYTTIGGFVALLISILAAIGVLTPDQATQATTHTNTLLALLPSAIGAIIGLISMFKATDAGVAKFFKGNKTMMLILILGLFGASAGAQSIFKPVPNNLFAVQEKGLKATETPSVWLWRFSAEITAVELIYNKETKQFDSQPLSSAGPAIGYRHYTSLPDGSPYNDFGVNFAALIGTDITHITPASIKAALFINAFQYLNVGVDYSIGSKTFGILLGASVNF